MNDTTKDIDEAACEGIRSLVRWLGEMGLDREQIGQMLIESGHRLTPFKPPEFVADDDVKNSFFEFWASSAGDAVMRSVLTPAQAMNALLAAASDVGTSWMGEQAAGDHLESHAADLATRMREAGNARALN